MAATSLILEARDFHPRSAQGVVDLVKWIPSTIVSVVNSSVASAVFHAAVSSPVSTSKGKPWAAALLAADRCSTIIALSRSMTPNSPKSLIC